MFAKSSMKALLLCGCGLFVLSNSFPITSTKAGEFPLFDTASAIVPASLAGRNASQSLDRPVTSSSVMPQQIETSLLPSGSPAILPGMGVGPAIKDVAPGENPFVPTGAKISTNAALGRPETGLQIPKAVPNVTVAKLDPATPATIGGVDNPFANAGDAATTNTTSADTTQEEHKVDETALRYYASTQDLKRLGAELRRLKALYPNWETPENLFDPVTSVQEQPLWDIFATGNYAAVRAELSRLQTANPQWKPSKDLIGKLRLAEARKVIDRSYAQKNWRQVIEMGQQTPELLVCGSINVLWQVGEALAQTRDYARAFDLYKYILSTCPVPEQRLSTVQKAGLLLPEAGLQSLIALGSIMPDGASEFEALGFDPLRAKMGKIASSDPVAEPVSATELEIFSSYVQRVGSGSDAGLFGWYYYSQQDFDAAKAWFTAAMRLTNDPKNVEGVVLCLRNAGKPDEAMAFAKRYGKNDPLVTKEYIEIVAAALTSEKSETVISEQELGTFEKAVFATKSAIGAQALGWKKLGEKDTKGAKVLFEQSLAWGPTEGGVIGRAVIATRAKDRVTLASLKTTYAEKYDGLKKLSLMGGNKRAPGKAALKNKKRKDDKPKGFFEVLFAKRDART